MEAEKVLITGHKGFIGKNLSKRFENSLCIEKSLMDDKEWIDKLYSYISLCDVIFHIGAISDTSLQDYNEMLKYNYIFSKIVFDMAQNKKKKVVFSSSAAIYGKDGFPINIYGWSKLLAENYGMAVCDDFVSLRYFNVYGPGEEHKDKMASVAYQAWKSCGFQLFPKKPKRDFVYIDDIVEANIYAINSPKGIFEVGSGEARTFEDILEIMELPYNYHEENKIPSWYQYYTKSDQSKWLPGWKPRYGLENGLKKYKEFLKNFDSLLKI